MGESADRSGWNLKQTEEHVHFTQPSQQIMTLVNKVWDSPQKRLTGKKQEVKRKSSRAKRWGGVWLTERTTKRSTKMEMNSGETWREPKERSLWKLSHPTEGPSLTRLHLRSPRSKGRLKACWAQREPSLRYLGFPQVPQGGEGAVSDLYPAASGASCWPSSLWIHHFNMLGVRSACLLPSLMSYSGLGLRNRCLQITVTLFSSLVPFFNFQPLYHCLCMFNYAGLSRGKALILMVFIHLCESLLSHSDPCWPELSARLCLSVFVITLDPTIH